MKLTTVFILFFYISIGYGHECHVLLTKYSNTNNKEQSFPWTQITQNNKVSVIDNAGYSSNSKNPYVTIYSLGKLRANKSIQVAISPPISNNGWNSFKVHFQVDFNKQPQEKVLTFRVLQDTLMRLIAQKFVSLEVSNNGYIGFTLADLAGNPNLKDNILYIRPPSSVSMVSRTQFIAHNIEPDNRIFIAEDRSKSSVQTVTFYFSDRYDLNTLKEIFSALIK